MGMWSIMEDGYDEFGRGMGFRSPEEEAYKEGCRHGYEKAMREMHSGGGSMGYRDEYSNRGNYGYRSNSGSQGQEGMSSERRFPGYFPEGPYMGYRGDEMDERRRRDSRGRYM